MHDDRSQDSCGEKATRSKQSHPRNQPKNTQIQYILSHEISIAAWKKNDLELGRCHVLCSRFTMVCGVPFIQGHRLPRLGSLQQVKIGAKLNDIISA